jgi:NAD(P)-dependent dehydrogenase (short-subunit alcohol dehydrogenase family)
MSQPLARTPKGCWGTPSDAAPAVLSLASPASRFITGQTLAVDGGYSIS